MKEKKRNASLAAFGVENIIMGENVIVENPNQTVNKTCNEICSCSGIPKESQIPEKYMMVISQWLVKKKSNKLYFSGCIADG